MSTTKDKQLVINRVREERIDLAKVLKKHTGIRRIVEELYPDSAHFIFELLQNAEDTGATDVKFELQDDFLAFEHNGQPFTEDDILGITDVGDGTKFDDQDTIGRFGVGFKAVFAYTESPRIWSPSYSFQIDELVLPSVLDDRLDLEPKTRFEFPFNNPKKKRDVAYAEVEAGLRDLEKSTLLFLTNIQTIVWNIADAKSGAVLRIEHSENHIEVLKEQNGATTSSSHFLRFAQPVTGMQRTSRHKVAVAFALEFLLDVKAYQSDLPLAKQFRIHTKTPGKVAVFFPAEKETSGLRFNLHAPFVPELSRASIKDTPANDPLFDQLATLAVEAMHKLKEMSFLTPEFLGALPNEQDEIGKKYRPIRSAIKKAFDDEALMPTYSKVHAPARHLYQSKASLKQLLRAEDIAFLIDYHDAPPQWAANRALQGTNVERFMNGLAISDWDVDDFLEVLETNTNEEWDEPDKEFMAWLEGKPVDWLQRMYAMFVRDPETQDELYRLTDARIVRLVDGSFSKPQNCYFPDEKREYIGVVPCVDPEILETGSSKVQKKAARHFLEEIGVGEIGEKELIQSLLENDYTSEDRALNKRKYVSNLRRFIRFLEENPYQGEVFENRKVFLGADGIWHSGGEIFLDAPFLETGLIEYFGIVGFPDNLVALSEEYLDMAIDASKVAQLADKIGAKRTIKIREVSCYSNPDWDYLVSVRGERHTSPIDQDYRIQKFEDFAESKSKRISVLIWHTMRSASTTVLSARFQKNWSHGCRNADSQLVHQLRRAAWVPQGDRFVKPAAARADLLPDGFDFDPGWQWIKRIEFGKDVKLENERIRAEAEAAIEKKNKRQAAAAELGFRDPGDLVWLEKIREMPTSQREQVLSDWERKKAAELPEHQPQNPERRAERVGTLAADAVERTTEDRIRSISVGREDVKTEAEQYLQQQYTGDDGIICQVCESPMPFRLDDGRAYFERVEFLTKLKKRHHQNYLALCPNHAAMFKHTSGTKDFLQEMFLELEDKRLEVVLAQQNATIYFTKTHIADLRKVIEVDANSDGVAVSEQDFEAS